MAAAVAAQERDGRPVDAADAKVVGRIAEGRAHPDPAGVVHPFHLVEPAASDHADHGLRRRLPS